MARGSSNKPGTSKVRLVVFEAEISDGDISQFTQAIQNALAPRQVIPSRVIAAPTSALISETSSSHDDEGETGLEEEQAGAKQARPPRPARNRTIKAPKVIDGLDWETAPSVRSFMEQFDLKTNFDRYLAVSLWFKEYRNIPAITASHVYTAFRYLGWSTSIPDFDKPFRNLRDNQYYTGGAKEGFSLNQLGEGKILGRRRVNG